MFSVIDDDKDMLESSWWSKLHPESKIAIPSAFKRQVRHVSHGRPIIYCNGEIHLMQLVVCYANHFVELIEIFP